MAKPVEDIDIFAERLAEVIGDKHVHKMDLQHADVVSAPTLRRYLAGEAIPNALALAKLASYLEVSADYLLGLSSIKTLPPRWIFDDGEVICSYCGNSGNTWYSFCPTCGKEMNVEL